MATVVRLKGDERGKVLGQGLGEAFMFIAEHRAKEREKEKRQALLQQALTTFSAGMRGETRSEPIPKSERTSQALSQGRGPTKEAARTLDRLPKERQVDITGQDVASLLLGADVDEKFAFSIAAGLDEARTNRVQQKKQSEAIMAAMTAAAQSGATRQDIIAAISQSDTDPDTKLSLLTNVDKFVDKKDDEDDFNISLFTPDGESITVPVPKLIAQSEQARNEFVAKNFPGYSATPIPKPEGADGGLKERSIRNMLEDGTIDKATADKLGANAFEVRGPDTEGRYFVFDKTKGQGTFMGGNQLTTSSLTKIEGRISSLTDAIFLLERTDPTNAGILNALASDVGGVAIQLPVTRAIAQALGLSEQEISEIQFERGKFFNALVPMAQSFSPGGSRSGYATKQQVDLATRIQNAINWSSTPGGAELAKQELLTIFKQIRTRLIAQRLTRSPIPPEIIEPVWELGEDGEIRGTLPGEGEQ